MTRVNLDVAAMFAHRVLRHIAAFIPARDISQLRVAQTPIPVDQVILGMYENMDSFNESIIVTDTSLWVCESGTIEEIPYAAMVSATWSPDQKRLANAVRIDMDDGTVKSIPVRGEQGGGRDVFEFVRFLSRVIGALRKPTASE